MELLPARLSGSSADFEGCLPSALPDASPLALAAPWREGLAGGREGKFGTAELQQQQMVDCKDIAETLLDCLRQTECMKGGKGAKECMKLTDECRVYRNTYFECKRSQLDMRTRIRGMKQH